MDKRIFNICPDCVLVLSDVGIILDVNPAFFKIANIISNKLLIGKPIYEFLEQTCQEGFKKMLRAAGTGKAADFIYVLKFNGSRKYIMAGVAISLQSGNDNVESILLVSRDITEQRQREEQLIKSEKRYRTIANEATDMITIHDQAGKILFVSHACEKLLGYKPAQMLSTFTKDYLYPEDNLLMRKSQIIAQKMKRSARIEFRLKRKSGKFIWVESMLKGIYSDETGNFQELIAITRDISKRKKEEKLAENNRARVLQSQKLESLGTLAGGIAHDFNNILSGIGGSLYLLKPNLDAVEFEKLIQNLNRSVERAAALTSQLLSFAKPSGLEKEKLYINSTIRSAMQIVTNALDKRVTIQTELLNDLPAIHGDKNQLIQVLMNLVVNANDSILEAMHRHLFGSIKISSNIFHSNENNSIYLPEDTYAVITVEDNGTGISEKVKKHIFDPFFTTKIVGKGTGLGLSISYGIIKNHGGEIFVESEQGKGSIFSIYLPIMDEKFEKSKLNSPLSNKRKSRKPQILLIDDEQMIREVLSDILEQSGINTLTASNGLIGLNLFKENIRKIDLILLDMNMPTMNGEETFDRCLELNPKIKCIFLSGFIESHVKDRLLSKGVIEIITKPFLPDEVIKKIKQALRQ